MPRKIIHLALIRKRAEVSAYVLRYPSAKLGEDLAAIDRVIGMFMPDFDPSKIKPVRPRLRYATGINHEAITILREAERACSTIEIAEAITAKRGGTFTKRERSDLVRAVGASLRPLRSSACSQRGADCWRGGRSPLHFPAGESCPNANSPAEAGLLLV